jgi:hypothetical protein
MNFRLFFAAAAASAALSAHASTYSDLWYDPQQPGSAVNVVQQLETAFVTVYSYGPDGRPTWLVASDARITAYSEPGAFPIFHGTLYRTEGSFHGGAYDPARSKVVPVGELSLEVLDRNRLRVYYTAEGTSVVRELRRYTFAQPIELSHYVAQFNLRQVRAGQPFGTLYVQADVLVHLDSGTGTGFLRADDQLGRRCEYRGPYEVTGKLVHFSGAYTCDRGDQPSGTFEMTDLEFTAHGLTGYLRTSAPTGDGQYGRLGGLRS